jgi:polysaccharide deacetylase 2 family uncharacterized protein YibQ
MIWGKGDTLKHLQQQKHKQRKLKNNLNQVAELLEINNHTNL